MKNIAKKNHTFERSMLLVDYSDHRTEANRSTHARRMGIVSCYRVDACV